MINAIIDWLNKNKDACVVIAMLIGGIWGLFTYFSRPADKPPPPGIVISAADYLTLLNSIKTDKQARISQAEPQDKQDLLQELEIIKEKIKHLEQSREAYEQKLTEAAKALADYQEQFSPKQIEQARQALSRGDTRAAEHLFQTARKKGSLLADQGKQQQAEAAFNLGKLAEARIDYTGARRYYEEAARLQPDNPAYLNAAGSLLQKMGKYAEAAPYFQGALQIREQTLPPDHPDVAESLNSLAELYYYQSQYAQAEPLYQRALKIREKALGLDHPDVAESLNNLAMLYQAQGQYAQAEPLLQRALQIGEKALGPEHPDVAISLNNLAILYQAQGQYAQAEPMFQRALQIKEKALGADHPGVATSLNNLAIFYQDQGQYAQAEPMFQRALHIWERALGPEHPNVAKSLNNLAMLYGAQGQYGKADPLYQRALQILEKALGPEHPDVANCYVNYCLTLYLTGRETDAALLLEERARARAIRENHKRANPPAEQKKD